MKKFNMISGLPRAGTTLLCNILNMNENFHVTPTSSLLDSIKSIRSNFSHEITWKAQNRIELLDDFKSGLNGFVNGFFKNKDIVFDKSRAWPNNIKLIDEILGNENSKIIFCYRDPVEVVGSIEAQHQKTYLIENMDEQSAPGAFATLDRRIGTFIGDGGIISFPIEAFIDAVEMGYGHRILIIKYFDLTNNTQEVLNLIHDFIEEPRVEYDFSKLKQTTFEYDGLYNYKFPHTIKEGEVKYKKSDVELPTKYIDIINQKFSSMNNFIFNNDPSALLGTNQDELTTRRLSIKLK